MHAQKKGNQQEEAATASFISLQPNKSELSK